MRYRCVIAVVLILTLTVFGVSGSGISVEQAVEGMAELTSSAKAAVVYCCNNNSVLVGKNADMPLPIASTTKIMTAIVALENIQMDKIISVDEQACGTEGSSIYLYKNEPISVRDLMYGLMLESANDAAVAIAIAASGSVEDFVELMNQKARTLGMENTHYTNPHGLDDDEHYSSARDLAILMDYAMENDEFRTITSTYKYTSQMAESEQQRAFYNHNRLLKSCNGVIGGKTGYTQKSGRCLVSVAKRNKITLCCVTLNDNDDWQDHASMYDMGFSCYKAETLPQEEFTFSVIGGVRDTVTALAAETEVVFENSYSPNNEVKVIHNDFYYAEIKESDILGYICYYNKGREVLRREIIATEGVERMTYKSIIEKIFGFIKGIF